MTNEAELWQQMHEDEVEFLRKIWLDIKIVWGRDGHHTGGLLSAEMVDRIGSHLGYGAVGVKGPTGEPVGPVVPPEPPLPPNDSYD